MLRWFAFALLIFACVAGLILLVQAIRRQGSSESRSVLFLILGIGLIVGVALLYLIRLVPWLAF